MCMLLCVILSVQLCFYHLSQGSVRPFCFWFFYYLKIFFNNHFLFNNFILFYFIFSSSFFLSFFSPFCFCFFNYLKIFFNNHFLFNNFILFYFLFFFLSFFFFLPFILRRVEDRLLVLQPGVRAVPLRWESQIQDTGPQETSQLHVIPNSKNLGEISISMPRPSSTQ